MKTLICGSFAFDNIMVYRGRFRDDILPDQVHILNVSFLVPEMRREFGGCAGNIAFNLAAIGGEAIPMGTVGRDFEPYAQWMDQCAVPRSHLRVIDDAWTAQAYITTDLDDNQITAFHPGAMNFAHEQSVPANGIELGILSPDGREGMLSHAREFTDAGIPWFFDPGQGLPMFDGEELRSFVDRATHVIVNDYEFEMLRDRTGWSLADITSRVEALILTRGSKGSVIHVDGEVHEIPCVSVDSVVDPTGCGDAYRGGLLYGLGAGMDWPTSGRLASLVASIKVGSHGTQNHQLEPSAIRGRFKQVFGYAID